jgi:hypothetical protein
LPRGTQRLAVNEENQMIAVGWLDNKAVHFVSTADTTETVTVQRRVGGTKVDVMAPVAISNYNKFMGGVDRHDRLRSTFSLCKKHKFKKYYVKLLLFIMDIGLTNSWIYYKMCNEAKCNSYGSRVDFFQDVAEIMVNSDVKWKQLYTTSENESEAMLSDRSSKVLNQCCSEGQQIYSNGSLLSNVMCVPLSLSAIPAKLSTKKKACQICKYEMRRLKWKSVTLCPRHGVRLCTEARKPREECSPSLVQLDGTPVTDWSWTCQTTDSCWNKFHNFYQPHGLFNKNFSLAAPSKCKFVAYIYTSNLYQKKYAALGITVKLKSGREVGMGRINEGQHIVHPNKKYTNNEESHSEDEQGYSTEDTASVIEDAIDNEK